MALQKKLRRIRPTRGLAADVPPWEVSGEHYTALRNVLIRNGFPQRKPGSRSAYGTLSTPPLHVRNVRLGSNFWMYFGEDEAHVVTGAVHTDITPSGGLNTVDAPHRWSSTLLNGIPVVNNGVDEPMFWTGDTNDELDALPDWPGGTLAGFLVAHRFHLFAFNITEGGVTYPMLVRWSNAAEPGALPDSWTPAAGNEAGSAQLSATPGGIITAANLGSSLMIYKRASTFSASYVGGNEVFRFDGIFSQAGALTSRAVVDINGRHLVVTDGDIVVHSGAGEPVSIASGLVKQFLFSQLDQDNFENLFVAYDRSRRDIWVCFPEAGAEFCTAALVFNEASEGWGVVDLAPTSHGAIGIVDDVETSDAWEDDDESWESDNSPWLKQSFAAATESLVLAQPGDGDAVDPELILMDTEDAVVTDALVARYGLHFDEPERVKFVRKLHLRGSSFGTLFVRVGSQMDPEGPVTWSPEATVTAPNQPVPCFAQGRYISVEVRSADDRVWTLTGIDFEVEMRGYY